MSRRSRRMLSLPWPASATIEQDGSTRLVYETQIVSYAETAFVLDAVEAKAGDTAARFSGVALEAMTVRLGDRTKPPAPANGTLQPGRSVLVFLMHDLGKVAAPRGERS